MKKLSKIFAITLAVLLSAASVLPLVFEGKIGDIVKREAAARLRVRLGFEKLDVSLLRHFPHASLDVRGLTLARLSPATRSRRPTASR